MEINACGLSCPQPVLLTLDAIKAKESKLTVLVDTTVACENVQRLARSQGYGVELEEDGDVFRLMLSKA